MFGSLVFFLSYVTVIEWLIPPYIGINLYICSRYFIFFQFIFFAFFFSQKKRLEVVLRMRSCLVSNLRWRHMRWAVLDRTSSCTNKHLKTWCSQMSTTDIDTDSIAAGMFANMQWRTRDSEGTFMTTNRNEYRNVANCRPTTIWVRDFPSWYKKASNPKKESYCSTEP